jgi:hypothetical protein
VAWAVAPNFKDSRAVRERWQIHLPTDSIKRTECRQYYCGEIRQMLAFLINPYFMKAVHRPDNFIHIIEYHRKKYP